MAPTDRSPKRQKLSPAEQQPPASAPASGVTAVKQPVTNNTSDIQDKTTSWYNRTWPRKGAPLTQIARESISSAGSVASEAVSVVKDKAVSQSSRKSSLALTLGRTTSNKALPADAAMTKEYATPLAPTPSRKSSAKVPLQDETKTATPVKPDIATKSQRDLATTKQDSPSAKKQDDTPKSAADGPPSVKAETERSTKKDVEQPLNASMAPRSWIGWFAKGEEQPSSSASQTQEPAVTTASAQKEEDKPTAALREPEVENGTSGQDLSEIDATNRLSWLYGWNSKPTLPQDTVQASSSTPKTTEPEIVPNDAGGKETAQSQTSSEASSIVSSLPQAQLKESGKSSGWVFWSRGNGSNTAAIGEHQPREGEIAISGTESQNRPRRASIGVDRKEDSKAKQTMNFPRSPVEIRNTEVKKDGIRVKELQKQDPQSSRTKTKIENSSASATAFAPTDAQTSRPASPAPSKKSYDHILLPGLHDTLRLPDNPGLLQQLARMFYYTKGPELRHLSLVKDPPKIKNALAIGVHGYFPAPLIRSVLGQPTGTSIKFADMAAKSIQRWTSKNGYECQVKTAALEGEGKIAERVELLWNLLLNWIDEIRKSDFVLIACHSQGVPVAIMLVAKLIHFGCLNNARVGICAMAGVNMGPFLEFKSRFIGGSAAELFEFSNPGSKVSADYLASLEDALKFGVRLTYVGSIDDQLVSLESSIFSPISHPHIYRAVSIDSKLHAPNFLSHLVGFALKLRNLGVEDHGLIRELSAPLAGSLYTGEGHSRIYEDEGIYDLAVSFTMETSSMPNTSILKRPAIASGGNPYILPFAMRGMLEEDFVKSQLQAEAEELLKEFDEWRPTSKVLKDVKFRLEGIRSRL